MKNYRLIFLIISLMIVLNNFAQNSATYIVLTSISDTTDAYYQTVKVLSNYRQAQIVQCNPNDINAVLPTLISIEPRYVAVVVKPMELNINFVRQFLMMSCNLDEDPFSDFSYGFITGATASDALNFVSKIILAELSEIENFPLNVGGYAASSINYVYTNSGDYLTYLNPNSYSCIYMETSDSGSGKQFFLDNSDYMLNNKILDIGHNGDPHMLWLFEGGNSTPNPAVWNYDPSKIEDTAYSRVGLTSYDIAALNLFPAVAFNGACHSGEPKQVMIEGDIAATFGDTQGSVEFFTMSDTFSFALSILKTGITGYFAPCGANNANDQGEEMYNAFLYDEPLGDIHKRTNDGVVMGFLGNKPNLRIYTQGSSTYYSDVLTSGTFDPNDWSGANSMLGGKANRIYFGDPLFNPYKNNHSEQLNITTSTLDSVDANTLNINLNFNKPDVYEAYFPVWDKFHFGDTRIYLPVELPDYVADITGFTVLSSSDVYNLVVHAIEHFDGKQILHIEVDIPNDMYEAINYNIVFQLTFQNNIATDEIDINRQISVFPVPSKYFTVIKFPNEKKQKYSIEITDIKGNIVKKLEQFISGSVIIDNTEFESGMYFFSIGNTSEFVGNGKFIIE